MSFPLRRGEVGGRSCRWLLEHVVRLGLELRHLDGLAAEQRIRPVLPAVGNGLLHATSRADDCAVARALAASRTAARAVVRARAVNSAIANNFAVAARRCRLGTRRLERRAQLRALGGELAHDAALADDARVWAQPQLLALVMGVVEVVLRTRSGRACVSSSRVSWLIKSHQISSGLLPRM